jgi:ubiquinone/menaquinone biosynthesis C-methylase UbiE
MTSVTQPSITIPDEVIRLAVEGHQHFKRYAPISPELETRDILDTSRAVKHAAMLQRYAKLERARILEIGSGYGLNMAVWIRHFGVDGYGVEPSSPEWGLSLEASRVLMSANKIDPERMINATAEALPFDDESFDIVYSSNVLEHVQDPERVMFEAVRVLKPGGVLHFEIPNFMSYYESHYTFLQPPMLSRKMLEIYAWLRGRDPEFARTINTIHPIWCRSVVKRLKKKYPVQLITLGEDIFLERMARPWVYQTERGEGDSSWIMSVLQKINVGNWVGRTIVLAQGHYPLYVTLRRAS